MATSMKIDVRTKNESSSDTFTVVGESQVCKICLKNPLKYTCPRCNLAYCSLECYKDEKHMGCSEAFYKECVIQELQGLKNVSDDKEKVIEMLKRDLDDRADDEDCEDEGEDDLAARLEGLDLDKDISVVWSRLSAKEKEEFARMFQDGRLANLIEIWTPWWKCQENLKLVQENETQKPQSTSSMPAIMTDIPDITSLLKNNRPSSDCRYDVINILYAYAFVTRMHNGSHQECLIDSSQLLLDVCVVLRKQDHCGSVGEAIQLALDCAIQMGKKSKESQLEFNLSILDDLEVLIAGPNKNKPSLTFMSAALSDLYTLFKMSLSQVKKEIKSNRSQTQDSTTCNLQVLKSSLFKAEKKVSFFLSWLQRYGMGVHQLIPLLKFEKEVRQGAVQEVEEIKYSIENNMDKLKPTSQPAESKIVELS